VVGDDQQLAVAMACRGKTQCCAGKMIH
jgi:hypothetical protein